MSDSPSFREALERGRTDSGLAVQDLWLLCLGMGFNESVEDLQAILDGTRAPSRHDYDVIAQCLNERLRDLGVRSQVPYAGEVAL